MQEVIARSIEDEEAFKIAVSPAESISALGKPAIVRFEKNSTIGDFCFEGA